MFVTADRIAGLAPHVDAHVATQLAGALEAAMPQFGVTDTLSCAHFMAEACWETQHFTRFEENLNYSHADTIARVWPRLSSRADLLVGKPHDLANAAYAQRNGNGSEASGDGWTFRGRGLFQLTGRAQYTEAAAALGHPYLADPDLVAKPQDAVLTALHYWRHNNCGAAARLDNVERVTRIINGPALDHLAERIELTERAKHIFVG
jgi:putative chitinase